MDGLIMDFPLTLPHILERAGKLFPRTEIVSKLPGGTTHRYTNADYYKRTRRLGEALQKLGMKKGDRIATLCWNHYRHLEAYFGIPCAGGVLHTLNLRLFPQDISYIANHAADRFLIVDDVLLPIYEQFKGDVKFEKVIVIRHDDKPLPSGMLDYEEVLKTATGDWDYPDIDERDALGICYTSGTTGRPKGVVYSHRGTVLHSFAGALVDSNAVCHNDVLLPVVPMFHANAWGLPYIALMVGAKQVFPGPHMDAESLLTQFEREKVTFSAGVPTIWLGILDALDKSPGKWKTVPGMRMACGGSAPPLSMIKRLKSYNMRLIHAWGMTEMTPLGTITYVKNTLQDLPEDERLSLFTKQGLPLPFVECRIWSDKGLAPWDGQTMGELQVRGPWIASGYLKGADKEKWTDDGWFRTGDIAVIDPEGYVKLTDRTKDVIKSGGEWISSVDLENAIMGHPDVKEAAVIAVEHPKWAERPLAIVVRQPGKNPSPDQIKEFIAPHFAKWWLPEGFAFVDEIPHTSTGKMLKAKLREQFKDWKWE